MAEIFKHTDSDGDYIEVEEEVTEGPDVTVCVNVTDASSGEEGSVWLTRAAVDRLRAVLAPYGTVEAATDIVEGREYRLLPGAHSATTDGPESCFEDATRVRVEAATDRDGDVRVSLLDGSRAGVWGTSGWYVDPKYLAPLDDPSDAAVAALRAKLTEADAAPAPLDPRWMAALRLARELRPTDSATGLRDFARMILAEVTR